MARLATIARRSFLFGSAAIAGGVAFGAYVVIKPHKNPLLDDLGEGEAALTPWIKITEDEIILIAPHADLGQGTLSMQCALLAEELELDFGQFETSFGTVSPAYYNRAATEDLIPVSPLDDSLPAEVKRGVGAAAGKVLGLQVTGGSSATADCFDKLREAGAIARETLKAAASVETGVPVQDLRAAGGMIHLPDGTARTYQSLAARAATLTPVKDVTLKDPSEWRLIGKPMQRLDIVAKSTGGLTYGIDLEIEGMVHAAVRTNPRKGGGVLRYDPKPALAMRGVLDVVPVSGGFAVLADNTWRAFKAAEAVDVDWGAADYPAEMEQHWDVLSSSFVDETIDSQDRNDGDVETALAGGAVVEAEYRAPYLAHAPMEPLSAIVEVREDGADVWAGTQMPGFVQANVARIAGLKKHQVRVHNQMIGGSFGHRLEDEQIKQATEIAVARKGVPIKLTYSREEDMAQDFPRQIAMARMKGSVKDGKVDALDLRIAMPSVARSQMGRQNFPMPGPDGQIVAGAWEQPFAIPNFRTTGHAVEGLSPISSWRSVGASSNGFFFNTALDELIHAAGADPLEERLRLCSHDVSRKVLEAVGDMSNWGGSPGVGRGRGIAYCLSFGVPVAEVVDVSQTDAGIRIDTVYVAADVGRVVDPVNFDNHVKGAVVWGLGHAMNCELTYSDGMVEQSNFYDFEGMRLYQCPQIHVQPLENGPRVKGIGEPPVPPAAPALAAAIFDLTGLRLREMPFNRFVDFA